MTENLFSVYIRLRPVLCGPGTTSRAAKQEMQAYMRAGWEHVGDDLGQSVNRATLQEAAELLELAEAVHPETFWTWTRAGLPLRLGHYTAVAEAYGSAGGDNARFAPAMVAQRKAKVAGTHDSVAKHTQHFEAQIAHCEADGVGLVPMIEVQYQPGQLRSRASNDCRRDLECAANRPQSLKLIPGSVRERGRNPKWGSDAKT